MKMKRVTLSFLTLAVSALFVLGCKKTADVAPDPDTDLQSSIDAAYSTFVVTDIDVMAGFMGENLLLSHFYTPVPGTEGTLGPATGTMYPLRDTISKTLGLFFNKTQCLDGKLRDGTIYMRYGLKDDATHNANYMHDYNFSAYVTLSEFKVNGWLIETIGGGFFYIDNTLTSDKWDPTKTNLTWSLRGNFKMTHPTDTNKNIYWNGTLTKTLVNTAKTFTLQKPGVPQTPITWSVAVVSYYGHSTGFTSRTIPFNLDVTSSNPLTRDFTCSSDKIAGVAMTATPGSLSQRVDQFHPIISGIASFTTQMGTPTQKYPRQIYFGNEGSPGLAPQCDNSGVVLIKGIAYPIDFMK